MRGMKAGALLSLLVASTSLQRRLIFASVVGVTLALCGAAVSIGVVLHRFLRGQLDGRLDDRIVALVSDVRGDADGRLALRRNQ